MISKDMYTLLSAIPKTPKEIQYKDLLNGLLKNGFNPSLGHDLLVDAHEKGDIKASSYKIEHSYIELTDKGTTALEERERNLANDLSNKKSYRAAIWAIIVTIICTVATIIFK